MEHKHKVWTGTVLLIIGLMILFLSTSTIFTGNVASSRLTITTDLFAGQGGGESDNCATAKRNNGDIDTVTSDLNNNNNWMLVCLKTSIPANCAIESIQDKWVVAGWDKMKVAPKITLVTNFYADRTGGYTHNIKFRSRQPNPGEQNLITSFNSFKDYDTINIKCTPTNGGNSVRKAVTRVNKHGFLELFCKSGKGCGDCNWASPDARDCPQSNTGQVQSGSSSESCPAGMIRIDNSYRDSSNQLIERSYCGCPEGKVWTVQGNSEACL